ncbi:hypothetical protein I79_000441 [Cricetulus griseus]|uniref:Secreted protein n=1 Tax=Cricetulus griseus TaxID=10029 RepID=G3GSC0_CRIGR|nr:hypothetical protein I79_000441 [Cricetulus griseus]
MKLSRVSQLNLLLWAVAQRTDLAGSIRLHFGCCQTNYNPKWIKCKNEVKRYNTGRVAVGTRLTQILSKQLIDQTG